MQIKLLLLFHRSGVIKIFSFCFLFSAWVTSAITGVNLFIGPVMGAFLNKFGYRITITLGCLTSSVGLALGSFTSSSIILLYFIFSLPFAVGQSLVFVSSAIIATNYFDKRKSVALGIIAAGQGLGTMILGPTLQVLVDLFDWRNTFRVFAGLLTLASLTGCLLHQRTSSPDENQETSSKKFRLNLSLLKNPTVLVLVTTAGFFLFSRSVPYVHLVSHVTSQSTHNYLLSSPLTLLIYLSDNFPIESQTHRRHVSAFIGSILSARQTTKGFCYKR